VTKFGVAPIRVPLLKERLSTVDFHIVACSDQQVSIVEFFYKANPLNEKVNPTEHFSSVRVPCPSQNLKGLH